MPRGEKKLDDGPSISLSGYQPPKEWSGLYLVAPQLWEALQEAWRVGDRTGESLRIPVVGVLEVVGATVARPGIDKHPTLDARFVRIEPVLQREGIPDAAAESVTGIMLALHDLRIGENPELETPDGEGVFTDSPGDGDGSPSGEATERAPRQRGQRRTGRPVELVPASEVFVEP